MITLAFYKGTLAENPHALPFDRLVCWWPKSRGRFSHAELALQRTDRTALCFSSSMRDGGVRGKWVDLSTGRWVFVDVPDVDADEARDWFTVHEGQRYDYPGILGYVLTFIKQLRDWWYCSEAVAAAVKCPIDGYIPPARLFAWAVAQPGAVVYEYEPGRWA